MPISVVGTSAVGSVNSSSMPAGTPLQVVSATTTTAVTINAGTGTYHDVGLQVTITPIDPNNNFAVWFCCPNLRKTTGGGTGAYFVGRCQVNGVDSSPSMSTGAMGYPETFSDHRYTWNGHAVLTSGFSAGSNTVKLQGTAPGSSSWVFAHQGQIQHLTVMEIAV